MKVKVNIDTKNLNTQARVDKAKLAATYLEQILNSDHFKAMMFNMPEKWRLGSSGKFKYMENNEIYDYIMSGKEEWNNVVDNEIDIIVDDYNGWWSKVVGYMIPRKPTIYVNTKFFDSMSVKRVVSNFLHEYGHSLGMRHSGPHLKSSIPYYLNHAVEEIFDKTITPLPYKFKKVCKGWWIFKRCKMVKYE